MRWLLLINLLAVVLLSGAVAIVIEGTPVGSGPSKALPAASIDDGPIAAAVDMTVGEQEPASPEEGGGLRPANIARAQTISPEQQERQIETLSQLASDQSTREQRERDPKGVDQTLVAAPDAPIPRPAPRALETEEVEAEPREVESTAIEETDSAQDPAEQAPPLVIATEGDFAPFNYVDGNGEPAGFDIDIAKELCRRIQRQCVFEVRPWADLIPSLRRADIDLVAASVRIPSIRPEGVMFSNPYYGSRGRFVVSKGAGIAGPGLLRVAGSQIAVQQGSIHEAYLNAQYAEVDLVRVRSLADALQHVARGKVEAAFGDNAAVLQWTKEQTCCATLGNPVTDETFFGEGIGLVMREEDRDLVDALNVQLEQMLEDGTKATLSERYFGGSIY